MVYRMMADAVLFVHFLFIVFVVLGALLVVKRRWVAWVHLPAAVWGALIEAVGWYCPLTPLENWLRLRGGEQGYSGGFIEHYLLPVIYPGDLTRTVQVTLAALVVVVNVAAYTYVWIHRRS
jgi:hypothetical protein